MDLLPNNCTRKVFVPGNNSNFVSQQTNFVVSQLNVFYFAIFLTCWLCFYPYFHAHFLGLRPPQLDYPTNLPNHRGSIVDAYAQAFCSIVIRKLMGFFYWLLWPVEIYDRFTYKWSTKILVFLKCKLLKSFYYTGLLIVY